MDLDDLESKGYICITEQVLVLKTCLEHVGEPNLIARNGDTSPSKIFRSLFQPAVDWLLISFNAQIPTKKSIKKQEKASIKEKEVWLYITILISQITSGGAPLKQFIHDTACAMLTERRYQQISELLDCANLDFFTVLNNSFKKLVQLPGTIALDETMWVWKASHPAVTVIPRKPKGQGVKTFTFCFKFTTTDLPYCWHFVPDIARPGLLAADLLDMADDILANFRDTSITTDSWFSRYARMASGNHVLCTTSLGNTEELALMRLCDWNLKFHEYRVFQCGQRIITIFKDRDLMRTASTCFDVRASNLAGRSPQAAVVGAHKPYPPCMPADAVPILLQLSHANMEVIASAFGEPKGIYILFKRFRDVADKVAGGTMKELVTRVTCQPEHIVDPDPESMLLFLY